jgi:cytosine/adenosine deaminase
MTSFLEQLMAQAVIRSITHVESGGIPFVGVIVDGQQAISEFGVNRVQETGDPSAHAEIVAIRDALSSSGKTDLRGTTLLATGEPCGMCYRHAINARITDIRVAVDRDQVAELGFDYRHSYPSFGITDSLRNSLMRPLRVSGDAEPFIRFLALQNLRN